MECHGRIHGEYPIVIPHKEILAEMIVEDDNLKTLHGGVGITMAVVRNAYWIPKPKLLSKQVIRRFYNCKIFRATALRKKRLAYYQQIRQMDKAISSGRKYWAIDVPNKKKRKKI